MKRFCMILINFFVIFLVHLKYIGLGHLSKYNTIYVFYAVKQTFFIVVSINSDLILIFLNWPRIVPSDLVV